MVQGSTAQRANVEPIRPNRIPPHNIDAEQSVLGAMLESKEAIANVIEVIKGDDFYKPAHTEIYEAIMSLYSQGEPADAITVAEELSRRGTLENIGGKPYIHGLLEAYPTASSAAHYARIVEELALLRALIQAGGSVQEIGFATPEDVTEAIDEAEELIYNVGDRRLKDDYHPIRELLVKAMEDVETLYERGEHLTGLASGFPDLDEMTAGFQGSNLIIVAARPAMGKCLEKTSKVVDPSTGEPMQISEFVARRVPGVQSLAHDGRLGNAEVSDWIPNGTKPCWRVRTRTGREIVATANHPFMKVDGWTPLEDLKLGDKLAVPRRVDVFGNDDSWSARRVRLLAYYIAEGGLTGSMPRFTNTDPFVVADFHNAVCGEFACETSFDKRGFTHRPRRRTREHPRNEVTEWLESLGLMGKSALQKRFPKEVWRFTKPLLTEFLKALFSCDGTIYSLRGLARIEFTVASKGLAEDVHHALLRFGVVSKLWQKTPRSWRVEITENRSVATYQSEIGWFGEKMLRLYPQPKSLSRSNVGHLPREAWKYVRKALDAHGMSLAELGRRAGEHFSNIHTSRGIPQNRLARYAEILDDDDLRFLSSDDLYWDEVVEIEEVGEREVYDLSVPDGHNFVAQDIVVHNSSLLNDFALQAATRTNIPVVMFTLEMSKEEVVQRFLASEAKVDSQRLRKGSLQEQDWGRLSSALGRLAEAPIFIDDSANISMMEMRAKCRRLKARHGLGLVIVDYLQLMQSPRKSENRQQEVSEISRNLKILARELGVPVICASQLNRGVEVRSDKRPLLGDLRESGCLTADTRIVRADTGATVTLGELLLNCETDVPVWTMDDDLKMTRGTMTHVFPSGIKDVYRLRLRSGRQVKASDNHPFLTFDGWRSLSELHVGDRVGIPRSLPNPTDEPVFDEAKLILLAHLIGDGCFASGQPLHYTSASEDNLQAVADSAQEAFGITGRRVAQRNWWHLYLAGHGNRWNPNPINTWLEELGIRGQRSYEKYIPVPVFGLSKEKIALFLRHLWATDGHVGMRTARQGRTPTVYYATTSRRLADDVALLLLRFGIVARIATTRKTGYGELFHVHVPGGAHRRTFVEEIGGFGPKKEAIEDVRSYLNQTHSLARVDTIPADVWQRFIIAAKDRAYKSISVGAGTNFQVQFNRWSPPSREMLSKLASYLADEELLTVSESDLFWDEIVAIDSLGPMPVFDATVVGTHNFVADGVLVHNSIEQDADVVCFIYRDEVYNPDSEAKGEAELIVAKHRNGPTGTVRLAFMNQYTKFASIARV